jgi:sulfonate transport system substrate-binding protein
MVLPLRAQGIVSVFYSSKGSPPATGPNQFVVTEDFEKKYPDATQRVVRGFLKAAQWLAQDENRREAIAIWARSGIPPAVIEEDVAGVPFRDQFNPLLDDFFRWQYGDSIAFEKDQKLIRNDVDLATWIEPKYQNAALASLGLQNFWPKRTVDGVPIN